MPVGLNETPGMFVDPACPINWDHPLNRGLTHMLSGLPNSGWRGGVKLRNIVKGGKLAPDATLTATPTWGISPTKMPSLTYNGSTQYGQVSINLSAYSALTVSFWLYWDSYANDFDMAMEYTADAGANAGFYIGPNWNTGVFEVGAGGGGGIGAKDYTRPAAATWLHFVACIDRAVAAAVTAFYINGIAQTATGTPGPATPGGNFANSTLNIMCRNGASLFGAGRMSDLRIYGGRILSAVQAGLLYQESRKGNPETLNWVGSKTYGFTQQAAPATGGTPIFNSGILSSRIISGGGIVA